MLGRNLFLAQRLSALAMAPFVVLHLIGMILAVQNGLTADEILSRTRGSLAWALFYGLFVLLVSVHAAIGLRVIVYEMLGWKGRRLDALTATFFLGLIWMGARAVVAVTAGGAA